MDSLKPLTIRSGSGLGRTSIAIQTVEGEPYKLWSTYKDGNKTILATCNYVDTLPSAWTIQSVIGENLVDATIVFDGNYVWKPPRWVMYTEDTPWIFYVTSSGSLMGGIYGTLYEEIATGVSSVSAIRGWKNHNFIDKDQGIVVAYIKNSTIYYRNYCLQETGSARWEPERALTYKAGLASRVSIFSLNDYRIGFSIEDTSGNISWTLSDRNWVGMAVTPEKITANPQCSLGITKVTYKQGYSDEILTLLPMVSLALLYGNTNIALTNVGNVDNGLGDWGWYIDFTITNDIINIPTVILTDLLGNTQVAIDHVEKLSDCVYRVVVSNTWEFGINDVEGDIQIDISNMQVASGDICEPVTAAFTPTNLSPSYFPVPEVEVIWNE